MKKLELVDKEVQTITLDQIDTEKHLVVTICKSGVNGVLRGNKDWGWKFAYSGGIEATVYSTIQKCMQCEVEKTDKILIYEL